MTNQTMTIYAQTLVDNRNYKNGKMNGEALGVPNARAWANAVKALRIPAYAIRQYRHANMGNAETVEPCDMTPFFNALHSVLALVGEVNGAKLDIHNMGEEVLAHAVRIVTIDLTVEMSNARLFLRYAQKAIDDPASIKSMVAMDEDVAAFLARLVAAIDAEDDLDAIVEECKAEVKRLESEPNNCKRNLAIQTESAFVKAVELLLGDAITKQAMKTAEEVAAEEEAKRQARRAKTAAKKAAKKNA